MREFIAARQALLSGSTDGAAAAREMSSLADEAVRELTRAASSLAPRRWTIVALGGWGSGALLPASDLDLLVLSDAAESQLKPFVEAILYPLWDAGLKVGHQVRSPGEQRKAMRDDLATCTATLTGRVIAGDAEWGRSELGRAVRDVARRRTRLLTELHGRPRPGSPYLLQPDLKDGAGGRRDYDELVWTARLIAGSPGCDLAPLTTAGLLSAEETARVGDAARAVSSARWDIQQDGRGGSVMTPERAFEVRIGAQTVHDALATTAATLELVRARLAGIEPDSGPLGFDEVLELLGSGDGCLARLESAAWSGRLDHLIAGFSELLTLRRPGLTHEYTVGAHSLRAAVAAARLFTEGTGAIATSCAAVTDRPALLLAALVHDVGKAQGGTDHARAGAEPAHDAALACGMRPSRAQDVADLVRLHLTLVETALREDIDDEDTVLRAAARIGRRELIAPLHVLTAADSLATGPGAWSAWHSSLVGALVSRIDAALSPEIDGAGLAASGASVRAVALSMLSDDASDDRRDFIRSASLRYLAARTAEEVVAHSELVDGFSGAGEPARTAVSPALVPGAYTLAVAAADRPELFARISGAIALAGLDILSAEAHGSHGGVALDVFTVRSATLAAPAPETWARLDRYLAAAIRDRLELETRLAERRRHYPPTAKRATKIRIEPGTGFGTIVRVETPDRAGLLYDLAKAIAACGLDIRWSKVVTANGVARDTFSVTGADGLAPTDPGVLGHVSMEIRARL